jgi:hypothetical protein
MKKTAYICGPMTNYPSFNFPAFDEAEAALSKDWIVVSPAQMDREMGFDPDRDQVSPEFMYQARKRDVDALEMADAVFVLPGWEKSVGATAEMWYARWRGIPVYAYPSGEEIGIPMQGSVRAFDTGATRDTDAGKIDYDGFLSYPVLHAFGEYMHQHRIQSDGSLRDSDNWQKGIPRPQYRKSAFRHFIDWWHAHRRGEDVTEQACALMFNVMGDLHEHLKP